MLKKLTILALIFHPIFSFASSAADLATLEATTQGRIGLSAINTANHQQIQYRATERFPMGCTSKIMGVAAILQKSTKHPELLNEKIIYHKSDLLEWAPITKNHLQDGMTIKELSAAAISYSDNTAMNLLTQKLGGIDKINSYARSINDHDFKLDHAWPDEARSGPDGLDSTTPNAMRQSLQALMLNNKLGKKQRDLLQEWLIANTTGDKRIRAGVPAGWIVGDKTGSGFDYGTTDDAAIIWPPKCAPIVMVVYYTSNIKNTPKREDILEKATRFALNKFAESDRCIKEALN